LPSLTLKINLPLIPKTSQELSKGEDVEKDEHEDEGEK
jgi:hypothetical protein